MTGLTGLCDCGAVSVTVPEAPETINACPCSYCRRVGAQWGYYPLADISVKGPTDTYRRASRSSDFHRCSRCGVVTHWWPDIDEIDFAGVNMTGFPPAALADVPVIEDP